MQSAFFCLFLFPLVVAQSIPADPTMTTALKQKVLDLHNDVRKAAANGTLAGLNGARFPKAAGMAAAVWGDGEFNFAYNSILAGCLNMGSPQANTWNTVSSGYLDGNTALTQAFAVWKAKLSAYDLNNLVVSSTTANEGTHLLWNQAYSTFKVGCAVKYCPDMRTRVACVYNPGGNVAGQAIYKAGTPCAECLPPQDCSAAQAVCSPYVNTVRVAALTDAQRMIALNAHNRNRSAVASGASQNKAGFAQLPAARDMYKMSWSRLVESYAVAKAQSCEWSHTYVNGTSNNLFATLGGYIPVDQALDAAVASWYSELAKDGQNGLVMNGANYNHFTQVVWGKTAEVACAVAYCPTMTGAGGQFNTFVVCDYAPAGNVGGQAIYTAGAAASGCPAGSSVESGTSLCKKTGVADIHN